MFVVVGKTTRNRKLHIYLHHRFNFNETNNTWQDIHFSTAEELSIVLANRSAALNHLEQYEDTLSDIKRCLALGYPRHLRYKVYERRARCLLVLKRNKEAISAFQ